MSDSPEVSNEPVNNGLNTKLTSELKGIQNEKERAQEISVKEVTAKDLLELDRIMPFGPKNYHQERLKMQQDGKSVYLIARNGTELAGHAELILGGPKESEVKESLSDIPEINGAEVRPEMQSNGIGTQIILAAEQAAREKGYKQICLGVSEKNPRARALYERLGYTARNLPRRSVTTQSGEQFSVEYLVKDL